MIISAFVLLFRVFITAAFFTLFRNVSDLSCLRAANRAKISIMLILSPAIGGVSPRINGHQNARIGSALFCKGMAHASCWPLHWMSQTPPPMSLFANCVANPMLSQSRLIRQCGRRCHLLRYRYHGTIIDRCSL